MKRLLSDRPHWQRVPQKRFYLAHLNEPDFQGFASLICLDAVTGPLWVNHVNQPIADQGYSWLQHIPSGAHHVLTTMFDAQGQVVQWYVDICRDQGIDERGVPWFDDLYLDIVLLPLGQIELLDEDELAEALQQGEITQADFDLAWREANILLDKIRNGSWSLPGQSIRHREMLLRSVTGSNGL